MHEHAPIDFNDVFLILTVIDIDIAAGYPEEQVLNQPDHIPDDGVDTENQDEEPAEMIEESPSGINHLLSYGIIADMLLIITILKSNVYLTFNC